MKIRGTGSSFRLATLLLLLAFWLHPASAQLLGPEFQVNTYTTDWQSKQKVAADDSGTFVVVWQSLLQDGEGTGVFAQRFDSAGNLVGSEFRVNTQSTSSQSSPSVTTDGLGGFVVVWLSFGQDRSDWGVFGQRFNSAGSKVGNEFQVNTFTTGNQFGPTVAANGSGSFVVTWFSAGQDGENYGVFGQRYNSSGARVGPEFQVNTYTTDSQRSPAVAGVGSGSFVVVWESKLQDGSAYGVFGQRFDSVGSKVGNEFLVNTNTSSSQGFPAVAADDSGGFVVAWQSVDQDGSGFGVFGRRFDSAGTPLGSEFQVNSHTAGSQRYPAVAVAGAGNFVVAWDSDFQDGSYGGLFGQRFNTGGTPAGSEFRINSYTTSAQGSPAVALDGTGNFVVVWDSYLQDGEGSGVFGQRGTNWILLDGFEAGDVCAWSAAAGSGGVCP